MKNSIRYFFFFLTKKLEKVGPFECDELEKHCRVSAKCYPTKLPALCAMTKEKRKIEKPNGRCYEGIKVETEYSNPLFRKTRKY